MSLNNVDEKYEFCAPRYFDFSRKETTDEIAQAESWFQTLEGYLPSPFVSKTRSLLEPKESFSNGGSYIAVQKLIARVSFEHGERNISSSGSNETPTGKEIIKIDSESRAICTAITCPPYSPKNSKVSGNASGNHISEDAKMYDESGEAITMAVKSASDNLKVSEIPGSGYLSVSSESETESFKTACLSSESRQLNLSPVLANDSSSGKIDEIAFASQEEQGVSHVSKIGCEASLCSSLVVGSLKEGQSNVDNIAKDATISASIFCEGKQKENNNATDISKEYGTSSEIQVAVGNLLANEECGVVKKHESYVRRHGKKKTLKRPLARSQRSKPEIPSASQICTQSQYANKRQKLEGGQSSQVYNLRGHITTVKAVPTLTIPQEFHFRTEERFQTHRGAHCQAFAPVCNLRGHIPNVKAVPTLTIPQEFHFRTEERFQTHRGTHYQAFAQGGNPASPYVPLAERVLRFQFNDTERLLTRHENQPLKLTRPKEPDLVTSQRARPTRVKSSAELEEDMLANIPTFKARPLNKKILEAPTLLPLPRSMPQLPEFQEFNLRTEERAHLHPHQSCKTACGPEIKCVSASHKCSFMLDGGFRAPYGHYAPTSIKHRTVERIEEEKGPQNRFEPLEYSSDMMSMPYLRPEEVAHLQRSTQENSDLLSSAMNVLPSATTQNYGNHLAHAVAEDVHESTGFENSQHVILKENMPHPSQIISGSTQGLETLSKGIIKSESKSLFSKESTHVSEKKRKPLSEIPHSSQFGTNNREPTWKGKSSDQSPPASVQKYSVLGNPEDSLQTAAFQMKNAVFARQDSHTVSSLSVPHHMR
ncbi:hypothetical protein KI387_024234 [Taxus chinensis]|uniref:TPX2 central domain-containing protein n=1 Tax=Taxus chinensis TaxID=29808 RepID=A0AA38LCL3_TAXCH|nr:hypothetical protein KI387_024234 [Taxus chinensis]